MGELLRVEHLRAESGQRTDGYLKVAEMQDGSPARVPVSLINGAEEGPTIYLQAISDGDELNGISVIRQVLKRLDPTVMSGRVIAVLIVNFHAFHAHQAFSPVDEKKMNRCFPGRKDGTSSERIAYRLFHNAVLQSDYCIDLHQGGRRPMIDEVRVRVDRRKRIHRVCMEMAQVFGIGYILDQRGPEGQLARSAPDEGIPTIDPELGGCMGWDRESIQKGITGVENVLKYYGVIPGEPFIPKKQVVVDGFLTMLSQSGWVYRVSRAALRSFAKGRSRCGYYRSVWQCARDIACARGVDFLVGKFAADGIKRRDGGDFGEEYSVCMNIKKQV